jgi:hypothetical protein
VDHHCTLLPTFQHEYDFLCEISGSHGGEHEDYSLVGKASFRLVEVIDVSDVRTASIITLMVEVVHAPEVSIYFNETTRRYIPK